jgi:L-asparaginase/Glu-tRNA(Gln) amidotransferase subunit D
MPNLLWDACHFHCITKLEKKKRKVPWTMATQGMHSKNSFENIIIHATRCRKQNFFGVQNFTKMRKKKSGYILSQDSQFLRKYSQILKKTIQKSFSPHMDSNLSLVAFSKN